MKNFFSLETTITPTLIRYLFWLALVAILLLSYHQFSQGPTHRMAALRILILGPIALRIVCEMIIVYFKKYQLLQKIDRQTQPD